MLFRSVRNFKTKKCVLIDIDTIENLKNAKSLISSGNFVPKWSSYLSHILWIRAQVLLQDKELVPHPASFPALYPRPSVSPESPSASQRGHFT